MPKKNENNSSKFLRDWIGKGEVRPRLQSLKKSTIKHDKWDTQDYERLLKEKELLDLAAAEDRITDSIETGGSLFADGYYTLSKAAPKVEDEGEVRPSHLINRRVMEESMELAEFDALREYCVSPNALVVTADLEWVRAGDLTEGDRLLAFDEEPVAPEGKTPYAREWRGSTVEKAYIRKLPCYDLTFDDGTTVRASEGHKWLGWKGSTHVWRRTDELIANESRGSCIMRVLPIWETKTSREAGYLAAAFDGEGWFSQTKHHDPRSKGVGTGLWSKSQLGFAQRDNPMYHEVVRMLKELDFEFRSQTSGPCRTITIGNSRGCRAERLRFLGSIRPQRLLANMSLDFGTMNTLSRARLVSKVFVGEQDVIAIATSTKTLIVEGLASHNSVGDEIGAALALIAMEPEYETLWDRLKNERKLAQQLAQQEQALEQQEKTVEELMKELEGLNPEDESWQEAQQNYQDNQDLLNQLRQQLAEGAAALSEQLDQDGPMIKNRVRSIVKKGLEEVGNAEASAQAWGLERGQLIRLDAATRLELANRLKNPRLKHIAELIGPMQRLAFAEQLRKTTHARDEVYDLSQGNDLERVLPLELMGIRHPLMRLDFYKRYINDELVQYELRGQERVAKGGIIVCEDGSGSMSGEPEMWAKAVSICCLQIAKAQDRSFYGIHFGSPGEIYCKDFRDPRNVTFEDVLDWAEVFFNGGTDFMTPLSKALEILQEEFQEKGAVSGDILFITDGACGVPEEWLQLFKEEQKRIGFRVFGCVIGGSRMSEPLRTICDGRVLTVADLKSGNDMRDIFREL